MPDKHHKRQPISADKRAANYAKQGKGTELTAKQRRRIKQNSH